MLKPKPFYIRYPQLDGVTREIEVQPRSWLWIVLQLATQQDLIPGDRLTRSVADISGADFHKLAIEVFLYYDQKKEDYEGMVAIKALEVS